MIKNIIKSNIISSKNPKTWVSNESNCKKNIDARYNIV